MSEPLTGPNRDGHGAASLLRFRTQRLDARAADGRNVAIWRDSWRDDPRGPAVVLCGGFARRMRHLGGISSYLAMNGCVVYRFDPLDHIGLSDGEIRNFTLSAFEASQRAVIDLVAKRDGGRPIVLLALSMGARAAIRRAAQDRRIARLVMLAGVVNVSATLARVFGHDYCGMNVDEIPELEVFESHSIGVRGVWRDNKAFDWDSLEGTRLELDRIQAPVVAVHPENDRWAAVEDLELAFASPNPAGPRHLFRLPFASHAIDKNPAALRIVLTQVTRAVIAPRIEAMDSVEVTAPSFEAMFQLALDEREQERVQTQAQLAAAAEDRHATAP